MPMNRISDQFFDVFVGKINGKGIILFRKQPAQGYRNLVEYFDGQIRNDQSDVF